MSTDFTTLPLPCSREATHAVFSKWLGAEYDANTLDAMLCAQAAHQLNDGDPLWLLILSGSGNAKTETVQALRGAGAWVESTIASEGALLSGTEAKSKAKNATGGLLRKIGDEGTLVIKDVTSILSMHRDTRSMVLAALREIYDGRWTRNLGTDGGKTLEWDGRITLVGAVTSAWDTAHSVIAAMGDRFVVIRSDSGNSKTRKVSGKRAMSNVGQELQMRKELSDAVGGVVARIDRTNSEQISLTEPEIDQLLLIADVVTRVRTAVEFDYRGNVEFAHEPEMPTRFAKQLVQLVRGGIAIGMDRKVAMKLAMRCGRDSMPPVRRRILLDLAENPESRKFEVRQRVKLPETTVRRQLDALTALGVVVVAEEEERNKSGDRKSVWRFSVSSELDIDSLREPVDETDPVHPNGRHVAPEMSVQGYLGDKDQEETTRGDSDNSGAPGAAQTPPDGHHHPPNDHVQDQSEPVNGAASGLPQWAPERYQGRRLS